jgi:hypothetical protein
MKFKATDEQLKEIIANAVLASRPVGMGFLSFDPSLHKKQILDSLASYTICRQHAIDYFQGRMVKLWLKSEGDIRSLPDRPPEPDYQSWCSRYPTYEDLVKSVEGVEICEE